MNPSSPRHSSMHQVSSPRRYYNVILLTDAATLSKGMHFGELALMKSGKRRTATVITNEDCHFAMLDKKSYTRAMGKAMQNKLAERVSFLKNYKIFININPSKLENLTYFLLKMECNRGQVIYREGVDEMDRLYFIKSGEFEMTKAINKPRLSIKHESNSKKFVDGSNVDYSKFKQQ